MNSTLAAMLRKSLLVLALISALAAPGAGALAQDGTPPAADERQQTGCGPATGRILYLPFDDDGDALPGVAVADPATGETLASLDLPEVTRLAPLHAPGLAVASTSGDEYFLIDAEAESATRLDVSPDSGSLVEWRQGVPAGVGTRYTFLSDGRDAYLLDVAAKSVTDVRALLPADSPPIPLNPILAPDEGTFALWDGIRLFLAPTNDPAALQPLTPDGQTSVPGGFSPDGRFILFGRASDDETVRRELVIAPVDGTEDPTVIARGNVFTGVFIGGNDRIAYIRFAEEENGIVGQTVLFDRRSGDETVLLTGDAEPTFLFPSPDGTRLLVDVMRSDDGHRYVDIDLATGNTVELTTLDGLFLSGESGSRWRVALPFAGVSDDAPLPGYYAIDLNTGTATILAPIAPDEIMTTIQPVYNAGATAALGAAFGPDGQKLWLFDLASATSTPIALDSFSGASISPDGCRLVYGARSGTSGEPPTITIDTPALDEPVVIGSGASPVWIDA